MSIVCIYLYTSVLNYNHKYSNVQILKFKIIESILHRMKSTIATANSPIGGRPLNETKGVQTARVLDIVRLRETSAYTTVCKFKLKP